MDDLEFLKTHLPASQDPGDAATGTARAALRARIAALRERRAKPSSRGPGTAPGAGSGWRRAIVVVNTAVGAFVLLGGVDRPEIAAAAALHKAAATARSQPSPTPLGRRRVPVR